MVCVLSYPLGASRKDLTLGASEGFTSKGVMRQDIKGKETQGPPPVRGVHIMRICFKKDATWVWQGRKRPGIDMIGAFTILHY